MYPLPVSTFFLFLWEDRYGVYDLRTLDVFFELFDIWIMLYRHLPKGKAAVTSSAGFVSAFSLASLGLDLGILTGI